MSAIHLDRTAAEFRQMAADSRRRAAESWDRSDTDGFMSQWASDVMSSAYEYAAEVVEEGGTARERVLYDMDGNLLDAREVEGRYGYSWLIRNADGSVRWFNESKAATPEKRAAANAKKGYQFGWVTGPAILVSGGSGHSVSYFARIQMDAERTPTGPAVDAA